MTKNKKYFQDLYSLLFQESKVLNKQCLLGMKEYIFYLIGIFFLLQLILDCIEQQYLSAILYFFGMISAIVLKRNKNDTKKAQIILTLIFWFGTIAYLYNQYYVNETNIELKIRNIWIYESIIQCFTLCLSLKYQVIYKLCYHILMANIGIKSFDNTIIQGIEYIVIIIMIIFNIIITTKTIVHQEKEYENKRQYEDIQYKFNGYSYKFGCDSQDKIYILESNKEKSYEKFVDYFLKKNLVYEQNLPYLAISFIDILELLMHEKNDERLSYKIDATSNKGKLNQKQYKILIMKQQENFQNIIFLRIYEINLEKQLENELVKTREQIFSSINHDIKNPLIAGCYLIQQIITCFLSGKQINYDDLEQLQYHLNMSLTLINGYFDFSQAQLGTLKIQPEKFILHETLVDTIKLMNHAALKKQVQLITQFDIKKIFSVNDVRRIQQVLINLIDNAIKFNDNSGKVIIQVEEIFNKNLFYINVIDSGVGISPQLLNKIGHPCATFNTQNKNSQGTGIGLFTSQKIVGLIGPFDKIFISSVEGQGSEFSFFMYLNAHDQIIKPQIERFNNNLDQILLFLRNDEIFVDFTEEQLESKIDDDCLFQKLSRYNSKQSLIDKSSFNIIILKKKKVIMIVDDERIIRLSTKNAINQLGKEKYIILEAENGQDGVDLFKKHNHSKNESTIDLIITDIQMPQLDGYQMVYEINQLISEKNYESPVIIALSSNSTNEYNEKCRALNIQKNLTKPQTTEQIKDIVRLFEQKKKSIRELSPQ